MLGKGISFNLRFRISTMSALIVLLCLLEAAFAVSKLNFALPLYINQHSLLREQAFVNTLISPLIETNEQEILDIISQDWTFNFFLYTRQNQLSDGYSLMLDSDNVRESSLNVNRTTKVIIHGWTDSSYAIWVQEMKQAYLQVGDYNVICVNWFPGSNTEYIYATNLIKKVGQQLANLLDFLQTNFQLVLSDVHLIGHSLGAHIAGLTGKQLSGEIGRITGMDPAKPLFENLLIQNSGDYLDSSDAQFVDIIHTSAGTVGFFAPIGHVDFYPNGGFATQPGCPFLLSQSCSHERSYEYMIESIQYPNAFLATSCSNWANYMLGYCKDSSQKTYMGENVDRSARGTYFLKTNSVYPFEKKHVK